MAVVLSNLLKHPCSEAFSKSCPTFLGDSAITRASIADCLLLNQRPVDFLHSLAVTATAFPDRTASMLLSPISGYRKALGFG